MVAWECSTNPREASGLDPEAVHTVLEDENEVRVLEIVPIDEAHKRYGF